MGFWDWLRGKDEGLEIDELARRLAVSADELDAIAPTYREFDIPKRSGGERRIHAPDPQLKALQRRIAQRLLGRLRCHSCATGFERGYSIVSNALHHAGRAVVVRMDLKDFFGSTRAKRVGKYFQAIGWNRAASKRLVELCTYQGALPQGAPTSPRLSNLVNHRLDARLDGLAAKLGAAYSRYADDLTFSFASDDPSAIHTLIRCTKYIVDAEGYTLHQTRKLHIRRQHQCQIVTGLVVNDRVSLPRKTRRWLRAVEHHIQKNRNATLTQAQLEGWRSLQSMIDRQVAAADLSQDRPSASLES